MTAGEGEKIGNLIVIKPSVMFCAAGTRDYNPFLTVISLIEQSTEQGWQFVFNYMLKSKSYLIVSQDRLFPHPEKRFPASQFMCHKVKQTLYEIPSSWGRWDSAI